MAVQGEEMFVVAHTAGRVLCCLCGVSMAPNPANMCVACLRSQVDITEGLQKHVTILYCPECQRYLQPPRGWVKAQAESRELLTFCIKRLKNLNKVRLVDAAFVWTEPHSKRLKVKLKIQKEVMHGAILEQSYVVEYVVEDHMCDSCTRAAANPDQWVAAVQVRQKVDHKRTFFFLEQLILKHGAAAEAINIKQLHDGLDFFYSSRSQALKFVDFLNGVVPVKSRHDKQLVSHDTKNNSYNYKFTFSVEICPICKDDLICLPQRVSAGLGNLGPLVLCTRVSNTLQLLDTQTLRSAFVDASQFWRSPYRPLVSSKQLVEYVVLDIECARGGEDANSRFALAHAQVARTCDFGKNDTMFYVTTHLGHLLRPGDYALGYDLYGSNLNEPEVDKYRGLVLPEAVLVKKSYENQRRRRRGKPRPWGLKSLAAEVDSSFATRQEEARSAAEYERFMEEVEEDPELRSKIKLYRNPNYVQGQQEGTASDMEDDEELPSVPLEELLGDLRLEEEEEEESEAMKASKDREAARRGMSWAVPDKFHSTSLVDNLDKKLLVILRDGKKLIGILRSFDQFANLVLEGAIERVIVGELFCDLPLGLYVIRGENVVLVGELDESKEDLPSQMLRVSPAEIKRAQKAERDATELKGTMRKRMEFLDLD